MVFPPYSLASIGGYLKKHHFEALGYDGSIGHHSRENFQKYLIDNKPELVVISTGSPSINSDLEVVALIKKCLPNVYIACIGTHVSNLSEEALLKCPELDVVIRNEPEDIVLKLAQEIQRKEYNFKSLGITFRYNGEIKKNEPAKFISNLDELGEPAWELFKFKEYLLPLKWRPYLMIAPLRGCPWSCTFCTAPSFYGSSLRKRSVDSIYNEIKRNVEVFGVRDFLFWADTFTIDKRFVLKLCLKIQELNINWVCNSRVDTIDEEIARAMKDAGCWMIAFGLESSNEEILKASKKGINKDQMQKAVATAQKVGLKTVGHFILGLPNETIHSAKESIEFAKSLKLSAFQFYGASPFPGTQLYDEALEKGLIPKSNFTIEYSQQKALLDNQEFSVEEQRKLIRYASFANLFRWPFFKLVLDTFSVKNLTLLINNFFKYYLVKQR